MPVIADDAGVPPAAGFFAGVLAAGLAGVDPADFGAAFVAGAFEGVDFFGSLSSIVILCTPSAKVSVYTTTCQASIRNWKSCFEELDDNDKSFLGRGVSMLLRLRPGK